MRPGRIDSIIHIAELDRNGMERAIKANVDPTVLSKDVDYSVVYSEMHGFLPAFVVEAVNRAVRYAVTRSKGKNVFQIETDDIVRAAQGLRNQLNLMNEAQEGTKTLLTVDDLVEKAVESAVTNVIENKLDRARILDEDGDLTGRVRTNS